MQPIKTPWLVRAGYGCITFRWVSETPYCGTLALGLEEGNLEYVGREPLATCQHEIEVVGLGGATRYFYQIVDEGGQIVFGGPGAVFRSAPNVGQVTPVHIWCIGDSWRATAYQRNVFQAYWSYKGGVAPDFWWLLGDNAYMHGTLEEYQRGLFDVYPELLANSPIVPTYGNHDGYNSSALHENGPYFDLFRFPKWGECGGVPSARAAYYAFDWANIHCVVLDTAQTIVSDPGSMLRWLIEDLSRAEADFTIVAMHHPPYTDASHRSDQESDLSWVRQNIAPILERYGVDLVLTGHSHGYERSHLLSGHYGPSASFDAARHIVDPGTVQDGVTCYYKQQRRGSHDSHGGTMYIVNGAGAQAETVGNHSAMALHEERIGSLVFDINGKVLVGRYLSSDRRVIDAFSIIKH